MATSETTLNNELREKYIKSVSEFLAGAGEEILVTGSNEIAFPCVDTDGNEKFMTLVFKIPKGERGGEAYNGYEKAEDYAAHVKAKEEKAKVAAEKKARKIEADKKLREEKAKLKALEDEKKEK